jgi:predicted membrane channel-forming protein YqfA (hemolysin III family)
MRLQARLAANRLDYSGVCNLIASTFQLPAAQALRGVST